MSRYITLVVSLVSTCILSGSVNSQLPKCCLFCGDQPVALSRHTKNLLRIDNPGSSGNTCDFRIRSEMSTDFIRIETTRFKLNESPGCRNEYIEIFHDSEHVSLPLEERLVSLGRWCGRSYAPQVDVRGNVVIRYFGSGPANDNFQMSVLSIEDDAIEKENHVVALESTPKYIYSPGYPANYLSLLNITWTFIRPSESDTINVEALEFRVEESLEGHCKYDYLKLLAVSPQNDVPMWCGTTGSKFYQVKSDLKLEFKTDSTKTDRGFLLRVYVTTGDSQKDHSCKPGEVRYLSATSNSKLLPILSTDTGGRTCHWKISADPSDVIQLEVVRWDDDVVPCGDRQLKIYDGNSSTASLLINKCGSTRPFGFIRSSSNHVVITSGLNSQHGADSLRFQIKFSSVYKYFFDRYHHEVVQSRSYMWIPVFSPVTDPRPEIHLRSDTPGERCVNVEVQTEWLHEIKGSYMDYVDVYDGTAPHSRLMGVCSLDEHSSVSGTTDTLRARIKTEVNEGFWLAIDTTGHCSGDTEILRVTTTNRQLDFPTSKMRLNSYFPSITECLWRLEKPGASDLLYLDVIDIAMHNAPGADCNSVGNYLIAYDGPDETDNRTNIWCNSERTNVTSLRNLWLKVRVGHMNQESMFRVYYRYQNYIPGDNEPLYASREWSYLTSPGYPSNYPNNVNYSWVLKSDWPTYQVKIELIEVHTDNCIEDFAKVYDVLTVRHHLIDTVCGYGYHSSSIQSTGSSLLINFVSDSQKTNKGFKLAYYSVRATTDNKQTFTATAAEHALYSPGYPQPYDVNKEWLWLLEADSDTSVVTLKLDGQENPCRSRSDRFLAYDGHDKSASILGDFCTMSNQIRVLQSHGSTLLLHLISSQISLQQGYNGHFRILYHSGKADRACLPGEFQHLQAHEYWSQLEYPLGSVEYPEDAECKWHIKAPNYTLTLTIEVVESDIETSYTCSYDYVTVYDGDAYGSNQIGVFCGGQLPTYKSTGPSFLLVFKSDNRIQGRGFTLRYRVTPPSSQSPDVPSSNQQSVGLLVGGTLGGVVLLLIAVTCFLCFLGKTKRNTNRPPAESTQPVVYNRNNSTVYVMSPVYMGNPVSANPPPPYPGITNPAYSASPCDELPPAYHEYTTGCQSPETPGGQIARSVQPHVNAPVLSPPPYSETLGEDLPENPPTYEVAVSQESDLGAGNSASAYNIPASASGTARTNDNTASPKSHVYRLGPM